MVICVYNNYFFPIGFLRQIKKFFFGILVVLIIPNMYSYNFKKISVFSDNYGRGPGAVRDSLLRGLSRLDINFNHNSKNKESFGDVAIVLSDRNYLSMALEQKKEGLVKKIILGPNFGPSKEESENYIKNFSVDAFVGPTQSINTFLNKYYLQKLGIFAHFYLWPAGVDENFWKPDNVQKNKNVLIYWKNNTEAFCSSIEKLVANYGWQPIRLRYGTYDIYQFRELLQQSRFAIFITESEAQGIALAESWAMDVPTIVWNPQIPFNYAGYHFTEVSSCPFLTKDTGKTFKTLDELNILLKNINQDLRSFSPRAWVEQNMTDKVSAQILLDIIKEHL